MKKILAVVFALIAMGHVHANGNEPGSPNGISVLKHGDVVKLYYRGEKVGKVRVTIYNEKGREVFTETLRNTEEFMRPYNFSFLPDGSYTIELNDSQGKQMKKVIHSVSGGKRVAHLSHVSKANNKYLLVVPNEGRDAITVKIFDERNRLLYQGRKVIDGDFAKVYNLNQIEGEYTFEIIDKSGKTNRLSKPRRYPAE
jgi:hypothetical protein